MAIYDKINHDAFIAHIGICVMDDTGITAGGGFKRGACNNCRSAGA
jgi:hypothetical protein